MVSRVPWPVAFAVLLLALLGALGTLQYRWLGDVSQAEHDRMRAALQTRVSDFATAFDDEISRTWAAFQIPLSSDADPAPVLAQAYDRWQSTTSDPGLITGIYLADVPRDGAGLAVRRLDAARRTLVSADLPPAFMTWAARTGGPTPKAPPLMFALADPIEPTTPALVVPAPRVQVLESPDRRIVSYAPAPGPIGFVVVTLDRARLLREVLEPLAAHAFGNGSEYAVTVAPRNAPDAPLLDLPAGSRTTPANADLTGDLFAVRPDVVARQMAAGKALAFVSRERFAVAIVHDGSRREGASAATDGPRGAWQVLVRGRGGPLDAVVARSRRRNLAVAFGVLALLAASFGLILVTAMRQRRLARQQIEFVASVSHELRTPLAAICSAGENLADGLVTGAERVEQYGALILAEGQKLSQMVERVMTFAGLASERAMRMVDDLDLERLAREAAAGADAGTRSVDVRVSGPGSLPAIRGDAEALRYALRNVIGNAVKYSPRGGRVDVVLEAAGAGLRVVVRDAGVGIDAADLPHVFKPFFRGQRAIASQARGSGIGLSIVRRVVDAHRGRVHIDSRPGVGTTVTIELPPDAGPARTAPEADRVA